MNKTKLDKIELKKEAFDHLAKILKPGDTVYTVLRHVSGSGMSRNIDVYAIRDNKPVYLSYSVATVLDYRRADDGSIKIGGAGMDMGFAIVYALSAWLYRDGFQCIGENCPANDHANGVDTKHHKDGGYALNQRWL